MKDVQQNDLAEARRLADALGLEKLTEPHLRQLLKASKLSAARRSLLEIQDLSPADEPAHVFRLP